MLRLFAHRCAVVLGGPAVVTMVVMVVVVVVVIVVVVVVVAVLVMVLVGVVVVALATAMVVVASHPLHVLSHSPGTVSHKFTEKISLTDLMATHCVCLHTYVLCRSL